MIDHMKPALRVGLGSFRRFAHLLTTYLFIFCVPMFGMYIVLDSVYASGADQISQYGNWLISTPSGLFLVIFSYGLLVQPFLASFCSFRIQWDDEPLGLSQSVVCDEPNQWVKALIKLQFFVAGFSITFLLLFYWFDMRHENNPLLCYVSFHAFVTILTLLTLFHTQFSTEMWTQLPNLLAFYSFVVSPGLIRAMIASFEIDDFNTCLLIFASVPLPKMLLYEALKSSLNQTTYETTTLPIEFQQRRGSVRLVGSTLDSDCLVLNFGPIGDDD